MRKILGTRDQYYDQTNDASVYLFDDYFNKKKMIACGPNAYVMGLDIAGWPLDIFTPEEQASDGVLMVLHNPFNLKRIIDRRSDISYDNYPPNEVPQAYDVVSDILYPGKNASEFIWGFDADIMTKSIDAGKPMMVSGEFPAGGHYVLIVGYDTIRNTIIFNDPYKIQWSDKNGYNREEKFMTFYNRMTYKCRNEFNKKVA